jgi:hypothetical protein
MSHHHWLPVSVTDSFSPLAAFAIERSVKKLATARAARPTAINAAQPVKVVRISGCDW